MIEWYVVPGYESLEIDNTMTKHVRIASNKKILTPKEDEHGYLYFIINGGKLPLHQMVALRWLIRPRVNYKLCIDHIDRNKHNNRVDNLRYASVVSNCMNQSNRKWEPLIPAVERIKFREYEGHKFNNDTFINCRDGCLYYTNTKEMYKCPTQRSGVYRYADEENKRVYIYQKDFKKPIATRRWRIFFEKLRPTLAQGVEISSNA